MKIQGELITKHEIYKMFQNATLCKRNDTLCLYSGVTVGPAEPVVWGGAGLWGPRAEAAGPAEL